MDMKGIKRYLPRTWVDWFAFLFMVIMVHVIVLYELLVVLNQIHEEFTLLYIFHVLFGVFLYLNVIGNMIKVMTTDSTSGSVVLPSILKEGWRFCSCCEANAPPRSFHCFICNRCILRRDHHCVFTGNCVGHTNQRYYMGLIGYLCVGAVYCNYLNMDYTWEIMGEMSLKTVLSMFLPLLAYILGYLGSYKFIVAFLSSLCLIGGCLLIALNSFHLNNIVRGQTTFERSRRVKLYDYGMKENVRQVFGEKWTIAWLFPTIESPLPSTGIEFPNKNEFENVKRL